MAGRFFTGQETDKSREKNFNYGLRLVNPTKGTGVFHESDIVV